MRIGNKIDSQGFFKYGREKEVVEEIEGVQFDIVILRDLAAIPKIPLSFTESVNKRMGRPPANWWPLLVVEMTVYVHENGRPKSQTELTNAMLIRLEDRGHLGVAKRSIDPVVSDLFHRMRWN